jgi:hypothetical protein
MNIRHAAALALVGWYLMEPPAVGTPPDHLGVNLVAPLSEWTMDDSYDSVEDCHTALMRQFEISQHAKCRTENECAVFQTQAKMAKCIATDDPRLKGK